MPHTTDYNAIIIGSGPNGLSAAIRLAQEGLSVLVIEGKDTIGGGTRTMGLTLPGFQHDVCSAIHPLGLASPFLRNLPLEQYGLEWIHPDAPLAHPLEGGRVVMLERSLDETAARLGKDGKAYRRLMQPLTESWEALMDDFLGPLPFPPKNPFLMTQFGIKAILSANGLAKLHFNDEPARALFAGMSGHSIMPLDWPSTAAFGLMLGILAHTVGWPMAKGGSHQITDALAAHLKSMGGEIITGQMVTSLDEIPASDIVLFDLTPRQILSLVGSKLKPKYHSQLKKYLYGPGVCKVDWALSEPIPWQAAETGRAATVHIGGTMEEIAYSEKVVWEGKHIDKPYVLLAQQSQFDPTRAPEGKHTAWAYCHVPNGSQEDRSGVIEDQIARFAPGFKDCILDRNVFTAHEMALYNPNYVGGDINGGVQNLKQLYTRPAIRWNPYFMPTTHSKDKFYICSSATPPGGGVHGMCGFYAAESAIKQVHK